MDQDYNINTITYGPCWCQGDVTTGGHYHSSTPPQVTFPQPVNGDTPLSQRERKAIFDVLVEIRDLLKGSS